MKKYNFLFWNFILLVTLNTLNLCLCSLEMFDLRNIFHILKVFEKNIKFLCLIQNYKIFTFHSLQYF